jgi:hypothetical protein
LGFLPKCANLILSFVSVECLYFIPFGLGICLHQSNISSWSFEIIQLVRRFWVMLFE